MPYHLYDYVDARGANAFAGWFRGLEKPARAKLRSRIDMLQVHGDSLFPDILTGTPVAGILKLRVKGSVQLRPLLCRGPAEVRLEYTFLMGATERDSRFDPEDAPERADDRRAVVAGDLTRRCVHERIT